MRKNPHAVALGRRGGKARTAALSPADLSRIGKLGGRPRKYLLTPSDGILYKLVNGSWEIAPDDKAAKAFLWRWRSKR